MDNDDDKVGLILLILLILCALSLFIETRIWI